MTKGTGKPAKHIGDPIEISLQQFAEFNKMTTNEINKDYPRIAEQAFNSETKLMGTLHKHDATNFVAAKGAVEELILKCTTFLNQDKIAPLTEADKKTFLAKAEEVQSKGTRVLAFAFKEANNLPTEDFVRI